MALQHLRSGTAHKRPIPTVMSAGQIAINTNEASPGLFFKDSNGDLVKVGPVHIGTTAPNSSPDSVAATALVTGTVYQILTVGTSDFTLVGASANTVGTIFTATGTTTGTGTVSGQQGVEKGEQWLDTTGGNYVLKIYDGTAWRSEAGEFVNVSGDTMTGDLVMNNANIVFEGATADDFETTLTVTDPTADRTITLPNVTGTVVTTGDTGSVTSTMIADGTIVNADVNASAAIAGTKINPDFGSQTIETTGVFSAATGAAATPSITFTGDANTGIYSPGADQFGVATGGSAALTIDSSQNVGIGKSSGGNKLEIEGQGDTKVVIDGRTDAANGSDAILELWSKNSSGTNNYGFIDYDGDGNFEIGSGGSGAGSVPLVFKINAQERLRIDSSGRLLVGTSSARTNVLTFAPALQVEGTTASTSRILATRNSNSQGAEPSLILAKSRGTSNSTNTIVQDDDRIGALEFSGADGANFISACSVRGEVDGTPGSGDMPGRLVFSTTADGASSPTEAFRITNQRHLKFADASADPSGGSNIWQKNGLGLALMGGQMAFYTGTTERMRIDSSGRLLVGTSSPVTTGVGVPLQIAQSNAGSIIALARNDTSTVSGNTLGRIEFFGNDSDGTYQSCAFMAAEADLDHATGDKPTRLVFSTTADGASSPTERMRISQNGVIDTFSTEATGVFNVRYSSGSGSNIVFACKAAATDTSTGSDRFRVRGDGDCENTNNSYGAISDVKLKENIVDANSQWDDLKAFQIRKYNFKKETGYSTHTQIGVVAQEVEAISPGLVTESPDLDEDSNDLGTVTKSVNYSVLYMKAVKALQEAMERIETLEQRLTDAGL